VRIYCALYYLVPFVSINQRLAGCASSRIFSLAALRRYKRVSSSRLCIAIEVAFHKVFSSPLFFAVGFSKTLD
jgi:hypothetical protein